MEINTTQNGDELLLAIVGKLDTTTSPVLAQSIDEKIESIQDLVLDFEKLDYISSAGLRVLLNTQKKMNKRGSLRLINVQESVMDILEMTGFADILNVE